MFYHLPGQPGEFGHVRMSGREERFLAVEDGGIGARRVVVAVELPRPERELEFVRALGAASLGFGDGRVRKVGNQLANKLPGFPMVSFGDIDPFPIYESRETSRFRFIRPAGNPPIVNEHIARGFRLGNSFDLTCSRAVKLGLILRVSEPPRGSVVKNLVQFLGSLPVA